MLPQVLSDYAGINTDFNCSYTPWGFCINSALYYKDSTCSLFYSDSLKFKAVSSLTGESYSSICDVTFGLWGTSSGNLWSVRKKIYYKSGYVHLAVLSHQKSHILQVKDC